MYLSHIRRAKFSHMIHPGACVHIEISRAAEKKALAFKIADASSAAVYSSGTLILSEDA
jgi:3-hydroxymyristoyl/3-hydroxydecanoyl-(acyl carrier protein) dehydratase